MSHRITDRILLSIRFAVLLAISACGDRCGTKVVDGPTPEPAAADPEATADPLQDRLAGLRGGVATLPTQADPSVPESAGAGPERESFRENARQLGEDAISQGRSEVAAEVGRVLIDAGEVRLAEAFLQRSVGLMKPAAGKKDHLYPLAELKRASGHPLEAASLYERAIDVEPTLPMEFAALSDLYLAAGRMGPAKAAVTRGLAKHPDAPQLQIQGAKVDLVGGDSAKALATLDSVLASDTTNLAARLVRIEALMSGGKLDEAASAAEGLRTELPDNAWGHVFSGAVAQAKGDQAGSDAFLARARDLAGSCPCTHEERLAIAWAAAVTQGGMVAARVRSEPSAEGLPPESKPQ